MVWPWRRDRGARRGTDGRPVGERGAPAGPHPVEPGGEGRPGNPLADPGFRRGLRPVPAGAGTERDSPLDRPRAADLAGVTPAGDRVEVRIGGRQGFVVLVFLATRCDGCMEFWQGLGGPQRSGLPSSLTPLVVTKEPPAVSLPDVIALAPPGVPVVMSDRAWADYGVLGYPHLVLVETATRTVVAETVGFCWQDLDALVRDSAR